MSNGPAKIYPVLVFCLFAHAFAYALDKPVYLVEGPVESSGIPYIYPNAAKVYTGTYRYMDSPVRVMFFSEKIIIPGEWKKYSCGGYRGYVFKDAVTDPEEEGTVFYYSYLPAGSVPAWGIFLRFSGDPDCAFTAAYIKRFIYLQRNWDPAFPPLMPAVIE